MREAVLDTSFWSAAVDVGVDAYLWLLFQKPILVPRTVRDEIERAAEGITGRIRADQQRFRIALEDGRLVCVEATRLHLRLGPGEAACIAVAQERSLTLLINEAKGYRLAAELGIEATHVAEIVARLYQREIISRDSATRMIAGLRFQTSPRLLDVASDFLSGERSE